MVNYDGLKLVFNEINGDHENDVFRGDPLVNSSDFLRPSTITREYHIADYNNKNQLIGNLIITLNYNHYFARI